jgi:hypothetical protein
MVGGAVAGVGTGAAGAPPVAIAISDLDNDSLVIRLTFTVNHLSRWLTPVHDQAKLTRAPRRGEPSVKELLLRLRDEELRVFPKVHLITVRTLPDLDKQPEPVRPPEGVARDRAATPLEVMAEFRRLRQSTCSHLRSLPDSAWPRVGISRREHDWTIRGLAEHLAAHDLAVLREMDEALERAGARAGITAASRVRLPELLRLAPARTRR